MPAKTQPHIAIVHRHRIPKPTPPSLFLHLLRYLNAPRRPDSQNPLSTNGIREAYP